MKYFTRCHASFSPTGSSLGWETETETTICEKYSTKNLFLSNHESHDDYPILMISIPLNSFGCVEIIPAKYITI